MYVILEKEINKKFQSNVAKQLRGTSQCQRLSSHTCTGEHNCTHVSTHNTHTHTHASIPAEHGSTCQYLGGVEAGHGEIQGHP